MRLCDGSIVFLFSGLMPLLWGRSALTLPSKKPASSAGFLLGLDLLGRASFYNWWRRGESNSGPTGNSLGSSTSLVFDLISVGSSRRRDLPSLVPLYLELNPGNSCPILTVIVTLLQNPTAEASGKRSRA